MKKSEVRLQLQNIIDKQNKGIEICTDERANILFKSVAKKLTVFLDLINRQSTIKPYGQMKKEPKYMNKATEDFMNNTPFGELFNNKK
jgi:hypothetical protein